VSSEPITVLHLVGGLEWRGGCARVVEKLASTRIPGVNHCVWMHCDYKPTTDELLFITKGRARNLDTGLLRDLLAVLHDFGPLFRWAGRRDRLVLQAHSRAGIFAASLVHWLTGARLIIHLHFLAGRPWLYRCLQRIFCAKMIYNSKRTCLHYGDDPHKASIFVPSITWPSQPPDRQDGPPRFIASGAFVPSKHFDLIVEAFSRLRAKGVRAKLMIFGLSDEPLDPVYQRRIVDDCEDKAAIDLRPWTLDWVGQLSAKDVFIHMGEPESFGIVLLEAFARGCRLLVLPDTFLNDLPEPLCSDGIYRLQKLAADELAQQMKKIVEEVALPIEFWHTRRNASRFFSVEHSAVEWARLYASLMA